MLTGHHLQATDGENIGKVIDVIGGAAADEPPKWIAVKTGIFSERLVPYEIVQERDDGAIVVPVSKSEVKQAPKVSAHVEPTGPELRELQRHYALDS